MESLIGDPISIMLDPINSQLQCKGDLEVNLTLLHIYRYWTAREIALEMHTDEGGRHIDFAAYNCTLGLFNPVLECSTSVLQWIPAGSSCFLLMCSSGSVITWSPMVRYSDSTIQ